MTSLERIASTVFVAFMIFAARCVDDASRPAFAFAALPVVGLAWAALYCRWLAGHHARTLTDRAGESRSISALREHPHSSPLVLTSLQASRLTPEHSDETYGRVA